MTFIEWLEIVFNMTIISGHGYNRLTDSDIDPAFY